MKKAGKNQPQQPPAVYTKTAWMKLAGIKRTKFYELPRKHLPLMVMVGDTEMVREQPEAWASRLAAEQAHEAVQAAFGSDAPQDPLSGK